MTAPEFSRPLSVARIPPKGVEESLEAKPAEREALAKRFDLVAIKALTATLAVKLQSQERVAVTGELKAEVVQRCIVTLDPLEAEITVPLNVLFIPQGNIADSENVTELNELDDEIDYYSGGKIDLGELVAEQMGINIDLYPRKEGASFGSSEFGPAIEEPRPLAGLNQALKHAKNNNKSKD